MDSCVSESMREDETARYVYRITHYRITVLISHGA